MEITATAKYVHMSPRKLRLVARAIRSLSVVDVMNKLSSIHKKAGDPIRMTIQSALANAKDRQVKSDALTIKTIEVMGGPTMKRWHAVSRGMAHSYKKRMTHIKVVLTDSKKST